uniref:Uncharacterized protein n=1 Tax=Caenorhabditis japonica TaxID=281687 RepID=A0A8R1DS95_CAEJA
MDKESPRPIDYWVCRATDRFIGSAERSKALDFIIESIHTDSVTAVAVDLFSHKLSSPSHEEAMLTVFALDYLVRNGGEKVHERCGRYRFLNELVKLLAPKYNGKITSDALKNEIIKLLFIWQLSIKHIPKYKQVYDSLKSSKIILEDPQVQETEVPVFQAPPARSSVFDDESQALLLKSLLSSNRPEDLQTANNLIKSLVETEEHKLVKIHERRKNLDQAVYLCKLIEQLQLNKVVETIGLSEYSSDNESTLQRLIEEVSETQETIYGYAHELAETNDPCLEEVLNINDLINKTLPKREEPRTGNRAPPSERVQCEFTLLIEGSLLNNMIESEFADEPVVTNFQTAQQRTPEKESKETANSIFETDFLSGQRLPAVAKAPTLNELKPCTTITLEELDVLAPAAPVEPASLSPKTIPETIELDPSSIVIRNRFPLVILDSKGVRILLYWCQSHLSVSNIHSYVVVIQNHNNFTIKDVTLSLKTNDKNVIIRLQSLTRDLAGFNIFGQQETINLLLCVQQLNDVKDVELDFTMEYRRKVESAISGSFVLTLIPEHTFNLNF